MSTDDDPLRQILVGAARLVETFGVWPSFHDSEIVDLRLERLGRDAYEGPVLLARIHLFMGRRAPERATGVSWHDHHLATLRFGSVRELELSGFNGQNAIMNLRVRRDGVLPHSAGVPAWRVEFEPAYGMGASFRCATIELVGLEPGIPSDSVYAD